MSALPVRVRADVQRILDAEARRRLEEGDRQPGGAARLAPTGRRDRDGLHRRANQIPANREWEIIVDADN